MVICDWVVDVVKYITKSPTFFIFCQSNLLASGANDSEIYIWDLNNFTSPMTPGAKTQVSTFITTNLELCKIKKHLLWFEEHFLYLEML